VQLAEQKVGARKLWIKSDSLLRVFLSYRLEFLPQQHAGRKEIAGS